MKRRDVLRTAGAGGAVLVAGCIGGGGGGGDGGDGGDGDGGTTAVGPSNYGLPECEDSNTTIRINEATLEVDEENEQAVVTLNYEFISGKGTAETPQQRAISVSFFVRLFDDQGEEIGSIAKSGYVGTDKKLERELVYSQNGWENAVSFSLSLDPKACA